MCLGGFFNFRLFYFNDSFVVQLHLNKAFTDKKLKEKAMLFIKRQFELKYFNYTFANSELGNGFWLKGGAARAAAQAYFEGREAVIQPRDLDLWVGDGADWNSLPGEFILDGEDWRHAPGGVMEILRHPIDVNVNRCILSSEGLWIHPEAEEGFRKKEIWRVDNVRPGKRSIRAHFFALRMGQGWEVRDCPLPQKHPYYRDTHSKAQDLGLLSEWREYLSVQGVVGRWERETEEEVKERLRKEAEEVEVIKIS
jgi:hypothetical protein